MSGNCAHISHVLHETPGRIVISKHAIAIALGELRDVRIHLRQRFIRHQLDFIADRRVAADNIEVVTIKLKPVPNEFRQLINLAIVFGADNCVRI